jgi:hypothetical protein
VTLDEEGADAMITEFDMDLEYGDAEIVHDFLKHGEYSDVIETLASEDAFKKTSVNHGPPLIE